MWWIEDKTQKQQEEEKSKRQRRLKQQPTQIDWARNDEEEKNGLK